MQKPLHVVLDKGLCLHCRKQLRGMNRLAIMADKRGLFGEIGRLLRVARAHHRPAVDEDLRPDLLGHGLAVQRDGAAAWRGNAGLQAQVGRVLGRAADAAPPEDRTFLDDVVQPGLSDLLGGQLARITIVGERARKGEGACDVVVGDDELMVAQRHVAAVVDVVVDRPEFPEGAFVGPTLEGAAEIDADQLAEDAGIDAFGIVMRN